MRIFHNLFLAGLILLSASAFTHQLFKTNLRINVRNELGNTVSGAEVSIFNNKEDYEKSENPVSTKTTDEKGNALFEDLQPQVYYVSAEKGDANNFGGGEKTDTLTANRLNKVTIIISE